MEKKGKELLDFKEKHGIKVRIYLIESKILFKVCTGIRIYNMKPRLCMPYIDASIQLIDFDDNSSHAKLTILEACYFINSIIFLGPWRRHNS